MTWQKKSWSAEYIQGVEIGVILKEGNRGEIGILFVSHENQREIGSFVACEPQVWDVSGNFYKQLTRAMVSFWAQTCYLNKRNH